MTDLNSNATQLPAAAQVRACGFCYPNVNYQPIEAEQSPIPPVKTGHTCAYCGTELYRYMNGGSNIAPNAHTFDHVQPRSRGGSNQRSNKVRCCRRCNQLKANLLLEEWRPDLQRELLVTLAD